MNNPIVTNEQIDTINARYHTNASPEDVEHYKLCQVILHLEAKLGIDGDSPDKPGNDDVENNGEK